MDEDDGIGLGDRYALPPAIEELRLRSLEQLRPLQPDGGRLGHLSAIARNVFGVPMVTISVMEHDRQVFQCADGLDMGESVPRKRTVCQAVIAGVYTRDGDPTLILEDAAAHPEFARLPGIGGDGGIRFYAGHPLYGPGGHAIGTFCLYDTVPRTLDSRQREILRQFAELAEQEIANASDLERAATVQRQLLPRHIGELPGYTLRALCTPAHRVGGDFYDYYRVRDGIVLTVADVMGKGLGAAILAASVRSALRAAIHTGELAGETTRLDRAVAVVADQLAGDFADTDAFVTLFCAHLDPDTATVTYVDAGHGLSLLARADGGVTQLGGQGLPIGITAGETWQAHQLVLGSGDTVAVVSDGALDLFAEQSGIEELREFLGRHTDPEDLCDSLNARSAEQLPLDDLTVVAMRRG